MSRSAGARPARYHIFVLSLWDAGSRAGEPAAWRFSLQDPHTAERRGFTGLAEMDAFLLEFMAQWSEEEDRRESWKGE